MNTPVEPELIAPQPDPPADRRETSLPARLIVTMDDCDYVVKRLLRHDDPGLSRHLYQYVVTFPLWDKLVKRAQLKYLRPFTRDLLLNGLCCQLVREDREDGQPDLVARARIWRHFAEQCAEGKSEVSDAQEWEIRGWIPKERTSPDRETRYCVHKLGGGKTCSKPFRVSPKSKQSQCPQHHQAEKFPGMAYEN
jgi:hypothetical protein